MTSQPKELTPAERSILLGILHTRFEQHYNRHPGLEWDKLHARLAADPAKLWALQAMETTGGEPDVVGYEAKTDQYLFVDCSAESPIGRRSVCYDQPAWEARKDHKPKTSALTMAAALGIELLTEGQYRALQQLGAFDTKTSSWLLTPAPIRARGGALFGDRRYDQVFVYHNGAEAYYGARGFRGALWV
jgi:hypothetical protein